MKESELGGLSQKEMKLLDKVENMTGYRQISLDNGEVKGIMASITNEETRRKLYNAEENLHKEINLPLME